MQVVRLAQALFAIFVFGTDLIVRYTRWDLITETLHFRVLHVVDCINNGDTNHAPNDKNETKKYDSHLFSIRQRSEIQMQHDVALQR